MSLKGLKLKCFVYAAHLPPALGQWVSRKKEKGLWRSALVCEGGGGGGGGGGGAPRHLTGQVKGGGGGGSVHGGGGLLWRWWRKEKTAWREGGREGEIGWIRRGYGHSSCSCRM